MEDNVLEASEEEILARVYTFTRQGRARAVFDVSKLVLGRHWRLVSPSEALVMPWPPDPTPIGATTLRHLRLPFVATGKGLWPRPASPGAHVPRGSYCQLLWIGL